MSRIAESGFRLAVHDASTSKGDHRLELLQIALDSEISAIKLYELILDSDSVSDADRVKLREILGDEKNHREILRKMMEE
jgi:rubrerythrin